MGMDLPLSASREAGGPGRTVSSPLFKSPSDLQELCPKGLCAKACLFASAVTVLFAP